MSKKIIIIIYFSVIILLSVLFSSLYTQTWDPVWNPFRLKPSAVMAEMGVEIAQVRTVHSDINFEIGIKNEEEFYIKGNIAGDGDNSDPENPRSAADFGLSFAAEGIEFSLAGQTKSIEETSYFKLTTIPALPFLEPMLAMSGIDLGELKNQWIKVDEESFKEIIGEEYKNLPRSAQQNLDSFGNEPIEKQKQKEMTKELIDLLKGKSFFKVEEELLDEEIEGVMFYHYLIFLDKEAVEKIFPQIFEITMEYTSEENETKISEKMTQEFLVEFSKGIDEFIEKSGEFTAEIWINKKDKLPYKIKFEKEIDISKFDENEEGMITVKLNIELSDFNQPKEIKAPETFKTLDEILIPFYLPLNEGDAFLISEEMFLK